MPDSAALPAFVPRPLLEMRVTHDTNVYRSSNTQVGDTVTELTPVALVDVRPAATQLSVGYRGKYAWYTTLKEENYYDHTLFAQGKLGNGDHRIGLQSYVARAHDARGRNGLSVVQGPLAFWRRGFAQTRLASDIIPGRLTMATTGAYIDSRYEDTANQWRNNRGTHMRLESLYAIGPKTRWTVALGRGSIVYPLTVGRDSIEMTYTTGVRWNATGKTTGEIEIGLQDKQNKVSTADYRGTYAQLDIEWERKTYSRSRLSIRRRTHESADNNAAYYVGTEARLDWRHKFNFRWNMGLQTSAQKNDYDTGRADWYGHVGTDVVYAWRRWLNATVDLNYQRRASNAAGFSYRGWALSVGISGTPF